MYAWYSSTDFAEAGASAGYVGENELKPWGEMTPEEINQNIQKQCRYCMYRSRNGSYFYCDYFFANDETLRNCSPINCEKFKEDIRKKRTTRPSMGK